MKRKLVTMVLVMAAVIGGCGRNAKAEEYYPLEELSSDGISTYALGHYKEQMQDSELFENDNFAFKVGFNDGEPYAVLYELTMTGKSVAEYNLQGDMVMDVIRGCYEPYVYDYKFQYDISIEDDTVIANRILIDEEFFQSSTIIDFKNQLIEAGYPDVEFTFSYDDGTLYYGEFEVRGDAAVAIQCNLYGNPTILGDYSFESSKGIIYTTDLNQG